MQVINEKNNQSFEDEIVFSWSFPEFPREKRDKKTMIVLSVFFAGILIYALFTKNFLFAIIILLTVFILVIREFQEPDEVIFSITKKGIVLGEKFIAYRDLDSFWILYDPPYLNNLYFSYKSKFKSEINVPLDENDPHQVREFLVKALKENLNQEDESFSDAVSKLFKF